MSDQEHEERMAEFVSHWPAGPPGQRGERGAAGRDSMTHGARRAIVVLFLLMVLLTGANLLVTTREVHNGERKWCTTLVLLTARPVPRPADPAANPSRQNAYVFYTDFLQLRRQLGCG